MNIGLCFTGAPHPVCDKINYAKNAEKEGLHSIWIAEDHFLRDAVSTLGSIAAATEKIKIATSIVNPYTRHLALLAMTIATLDELSNGRIILGLGASDKNHLEQMGISYDSPLTKIRESVEVIRKRDMESARSRQYSAGSGASAFPSPATPLTKTYSITFGYLLGSSPSPSTFKFGRSISTVSAYLPSRRTPRLSMLCTRADIFAVF